MRLNLTPCYHYNNLLFFKLYLKPWNHLSDSPLGDGCDTLLGDLILSLSRDLNDYLKDRFILVLEPRANYRASLKNFLLNLKVKQVRFVGSVAEAKREMLTLKVGLFICEWLLPEKNGLQFCRELRKDKQYKATPFLLLSTENLRKDVILASEGGVDAYLLKPFSYEDFCAQIEMMIAATKNPSALISILERADSHADQKEFWVAEALYKEALAIRPTSAKALTGLGRLQLAEKNRPKALAYFQQAITNNPEYIDGYKCILQVSEEAGDPHGILQNATILQNLSPENPRYPLLIAYAHMELGNLSQSEIEFKCCIRLSPAVADGYKGLGHLYLQQKDYEKARKTLAKALELDRGDVSVLNSLGLSYVRQNMLDEGIQKYRVALSIDASDERVLFNLAIAMELKGDLSAAREMLLRAIAANSDFEKAKRNLERIQVLILSSKSQQPSSDSFESEEVPPLVKKGA
jgi:tetratricopeptide (TPR) repeat protein